ncbi:MAG: sensor histidine kinase, partial [Bacteroidia bacterium]
NRGVGFYNHHSSKEFDILDLPSPVVSLLKQSNHVYVICTNGNIYHLLNSKVHLVKGIENLNVINDGIIKDNKLFVAGNLGVHIYKLINPSTFHYISTLNLKGVRKIYNFNNQIYYLTNKAVYLDLQKKQEVLIPEINLENLLVNNHSFPINDSKLFQYNQNNIGFIVKAISYQTKYIKLKYRLLGLNEDYNYTSDIMINFSGLNPGTYTFAVSASNNGIDYSKEITYPFIILKPFWQRTWFILIVVTLIISISLLIVKFKIRQLKKESELNESISRLKSQALTSQLNPHLVFNILNSIQSIVAKGDIEKANIFISRFAKFMRQSLWASQNSNITISKELELTKNYISLELLRFPDSLEIQFQNNLTNENYLVPSLILQPFVENAIKHGVMPTLSKNGIVKIILSEDVANFYIQIVDNGKGYGEKIEMGDGLRISKERLKLLNNKNTIEFNRKDGLTIVTLKIFK